ncbi:MAG: ErpK protein [Clostridiaceae bacterium]|nr:ErpK protein [Clostridiaceae bacterium]
MGRRCISIDEKISRQKEVVSAMKDKYDSALNELNALMKKKRELQGKELLNTFENSSRSLDEIMTFLNENNDRNSLFVFES